MVHIIKNTNVATFWISLDEVGVNYLLRISIS